MKLHMDAGANILRITSYDGDSVTIAERQLTTSFAVTPQSLFENPGATAFHELSWGALTDLHDLELEILVLGTGMTQRFPEPSFYAEVAAARVGLEVMDNGAACRTYNILAGEDRRVAALLLMEKS